MSIYNGYEKNEEQLMMRYINGINSTIQDELAMQYVESVNEAYHLALKSEEKLSKQFRKRPFVNNTVIPYQ